MVLKQIIARNIQSLCEVVIDLPPTGLVVFTGPNSNGKSIIIRATRILVSGLLRKPIKRASLVNRNATFGELTYVRDDDTTLTMHVAREANLTYIKYCEPGEEPIVRYLADKSYPELVRRFGWHYDEMAGVSLQIAEEEDALLFYKTPHKHIASIIETATTDTTANKVAESFTTTLKEARSFREKWVQSASTYTVALHELKVENTAPLEERRCRLERLLRNLEAIYFPNIPDITPVPKVRFAAVHKPSIPAIKYPRILQVGCTIPDIIPVAEELKTLKEHKCPMCGRGFDCECESVVH